MVDRPRATRSLPAVSTLTATAIVVADMIGVGVFTRLGFQARDVPSGFALVLPWAIGGVVALCGALCYAELATLFPRSGGKYTFLSHMYGPAVGFMAGWLPATLPARNTSSRYAAVLDCFTTVAKVRAPAMKPSAASSPESG